MQTKPALASKTLVFNGAMLLAALAFLVNLGGFLTDQAFVQQFPKVAAGITAAVAVINIILRMVTSTGIKLGGNDNP